jgi:hypothetical protein
MLKTAKLKNVGPAPELTVDFQERLNLLTGDNGLGKSFLLDVAWWILTRKWPHDLNGQLTSGYPARPTNPKEQASIAFELTTANEKSVAYESNYDRPSQSWVGRAGRPWNPGLVIYAHADGGFSVWDPARNYWKKKGNLDVQERLPGYVFSPKNVWDGLEADVEGKVTRVCNGLLVDWAAWIREAGSQAELMKLILERLAPTDEGLRVGPLARLSVDDARDIPTIQMPYGTSVPVLHAASGVKRILGLAYMLLWSWNEHLRASELLGQEPTKAVVLLFDELESHLHPKWQRTILSSLLHIVEALHSDAKVQLIAATHSPLILASAEPFFDSGRDAWFDIDLEANQVILRRRHFVKRGEVSNWLTSEAFDLKEARSIESEQAIGKALDLLRDSKPTKEAIESVDAILKKAGLPDIDPFWMRWGFFKEQNGFPKEPNDNPAEKKQE